MYVHVVCTVEWVTCDRNWNFEFRVARAKQITGYCHFDTVNGLPSSIFGLAEAKSISMPGGWCINSTQDCTFYIGTEIEKRREWARNWRKRRACRYQVLCITLEDYCRLASLRPPSLIDSSLHCSGDTTVLQIKQLHPKRHPASTSEYTVVLDCYSLDWRRWSS